MIKRPFPIDLRGPAAGLITTLAGLAQTLGASGPTFDDVPYSDHERQVLDFYQADSRRKSPVVIYFHGGGWVKGSESRVPALKSYLNAGVSVVSVRYRLLSGARDEGIEPPVKAPMEDAARAVQFVRSKASEWKIDPKQIGLTGTSAGACSALWVAFHDDLANPRSTDEVSRESTRVSCVAVRIAQTSLDPEQMKEWTPNSSYGGRAFGYRRFDDFLDDRRKLLRWIREYSPIEHASADDPPVHLVYVSPPDFGNNQKDATHTANFGVGLKQKLDELNVPCELVYPGAPDVETSRTDQFLIDTLTR